MRRETTAQRSLAVLAMSSLAVLWPAAAASAHPLGNFTVNLYSGIHVVPGEIRIDYVIDMAEIPTFQETPSIDTDGDGTMSAAELAAWAAAQAPLLERNLTLTVDGRPVSLVARSTDARLRDGQGGLPILRFEGTFAAPVDRTGRIAYRDGNDADTIGWREITAVGEDGEAIRGSDVPAESVSDALLSYPQDLLSSPLRVTSMRASFGPGISVGPTERTSAPIETARPGVDLSAFSSLVDNHGIVLVLAAFALAVAFGAWHALLPGHGKTLMAAYMVGSETKVRHAVAVGSAVAVMHTASVLGLGLLVITLEQTFRPESLYPWLGLLSGVVAIGLGAYLMIGRLAAWSEARRDDAHEREHAAEHDHDHDHDHGHTHGLPARRVPHVEERAAGARAGRRHPAVAERADRDARCDQRAPRRLRDRADPGVQRRPGPGVDRGQPRRAPRPGGHGGPPLLVLGAARAGALGVGDRRGRGVPGRPRRDPDLRRRRRRRIQLSWPSARPRARGVSGVDPAGSTEIRMRSYRLGSNSSATTIIPGSGTKSVAHVAWVPESSHTR